MESILKAWSFFDGKKTALAAIMATVMGVASGIGLIWNLDQYLWWPKVMATGNLLAGALGGVGLTHKVYKASRV